MNYKESELFILRRCLWFGRTTRQDVLRAFPATTSTATASRALDSAAARWPSVLYRKPKWIEAAPHPNIPERLKPLVDARCMLRMLQENPARFAQIGLDVDELNFVQQRLRCHFLADASPCSRAIPEPMLALILRACILHARIDIRYVGLRLGESARWRSVTPVALNELQGQWRMMAHDLEAEGYPLKSFVIPRILDARASLEKQPKGLRLQTGDIPVRRYAIKLNPRMTADQKTALRRELGITEQDEIMLTDDALFDFKKTWMESQLDPNLSIVWPLVVDLDRKS